ncbi:chemotaxis protein CheX [Thermodesulfobacteriota bacterium]
MDEQLKRTIFETMSEVFETMFFTFLEPVSALPSEGSVGENLEYIEGKISFMCDTEGGVSIYFPRGLAQFITVNFLGFEEEEVTERQILDTVRETVNMSVGSLLGKIDPEGVCNLQIPEAKTVVDFSANLLLSEPGLCLFNTEFGYLWVVYKGN